MSLLSNNALKLCASLEYFSYLIFFIIIYFYLYFLYCIGAKFRFQLFFFNFYFFFAGGHYIISIKANCVDSTAPAEAVFAGEIDKLKADHLRPLEQLTLEPYERDHAVVVGIYRSEKK